MSNNSNNINNIVENINSSINNSSKNMISLGHPLKNSVSDQIIFFKEDILKDIKQFESQITIKYNSELNKNNRKIIQIQENLEEMSQKLDKISSMINFDSNLQERTEKLSNLFSKLEQSFLLQDVKLKKTNEKLTDAIDRFNKEISDNIMYPSVIGPLSKFKTFHEYIDFTIFNINALLMFKDKIYAELKDFKNKAENNMNNFQVKLDYQTKNCNAFTSASIRASEEKLGNVWKDALNIEMDKINQKLEIYWKNQEEKNLNIIENTERIKTVEQNFEKLETEKNKKANRRTIELNQEMIYLKNKGNKHERAIKNIIGGKKASSIVKQYIQGKLKTEELFGRRRSVEGNIYNINIKDKIGININHNSDKDLTILQDNQITNDNIIIKARFIENKKAPISEPNRERMDEDESSLNEESESQNDIETEKNKIKEEINNILYKNSKNYKPLQELKEDKDNFILNYLKLLYQESPSTTVKENNFVTPPKTTKNINNEIKLIKDGENIPINKNLYITNNENYLRKGINNTTAKITDPKIIKVSNIKTLELSKISSPISTNIKKKYETNDVKEIINQVKKLNKENLMPIKPINNKPSPKIQNHLYKTKSLISLTSLTYKPNTRNKILFNSDNKNNSQNIHINPQNYSFYKQNPKNNNIINGAKKINMNFSSFNENNKEKDEQKMKKVFNQIKDIIQEDEKIIIKNRFINYGYNKDIIFAEDKKGIIGNKIENKRNINLK